MTTHDDAEEQVELSDGRNFDLLLTPRANQSHSEYELRRDAELARLYA